MLNTANNLNAAAPILRVENFSKHYEGKLAVDHLSFEAFGGEILGLVGPNGAGKTTTLRSIAGILPIKDGRVFIYDNDISRDEVNAKRRLAWVPDDPQPFDALTVYEHLEFTAALYQVPDWKPRAEELLTKFELQEKRTALGGELSRGMRQKLSFCCAWLSRPKLVLLDEPLTGLDPLGIRSAKQAIKDLAAEGTAVILSSHLLDLVAELAHRILILNLGKRVFIGTIAEARASLTPDANSSLEDIFLAATDRTVRPRTPDAPLAPPTVPAENPGEVRPE
ncbi:MAG: ABC transporter ATP-binding protein [Planctomycetota bacterium]